METEMDDVMMIVDEITIQRYIMWNGMDMHN